MEQIMGPKEMAVAFRTAKKKAEQIKILSEINCMTVNEVKNILKAEGCQLRGVGDAPELRKTRASNKVNECNVIAEPVINEDIKQTDSLDPAEMVAQASVTVAVPEFIVDLVKEKITELKMMIQAREIEIQKLRNQELELAEYIGIK